MIFLSSRDDNMQSAMTSTVRWYKNAQEKNRGPCSPPWQSAAVMDEYFMLDI